MRLIILILSMFILSGCNQDQSTATNTPTSQQPTESKQPKRIFISSEDTTIQTQQEAQSKQAHITRQHTDRLTELKRIEEDERLKRIAAQKEKQRQLALAKQKAKEAEKERIRKINANKKWYDMDLNNDGYWSDYELSLMTDKQRAAYNLHWDTQPTEEDIEESYAEPEPSKQWYCDQITFGIEQGYIDESERGDCGY